MHTLKGKNVDARLWLDPKTVESQALDQIRNLTTLPVVRHVAVMPDAHFGIGATVGSVVAMKGAVSPAAVGVDIGCGMAACRTNLTAEDLPDSLKELRRGIEELIPVGFNWHKEPVAVSALFDEFRSLDRRVHNLETKARQQCGTLGGGNHFIEVCLDTTGRVWLMLHSGSRNIGKELAEIHIATAKALGHNEGLVDRDLAYFLAGTPEMAAYRRDLFWAQRYAWLNRHVMMDLLQQAVMVFIPKAEFEEPIQAHHNYVSEETHFGEELLVTRKGAISARKGEMGIIPGSMGTKSYIVRGLGNPDSLHSASHGAGRRMSRGKAKKTFTMEDFEAQTVGVECRRDSGVLDEIPGAYKPIEEVMANQSDLVEIVAELKQVLCVKG